MKCYIEGYKYGKCSIYSYVGLKCPKETYITISYSCRNQTPTKKGIEGGINDERIELGK